jgi:hypothetical protein
VKFVVKQGDILMSGDTYNTGVAGPVRPGAQASNVTINQNYGAVLEGTDLPTLAAEAIKKASGL